MMSIRSALRRVWQLLRTEVPEGGCVPKWQGVAYWRVDRATTVCWFLPLNLIARVIGRAYLWAHVKYRPTALELLAARARTAGYANGYQIGYSRGYQSAFNAIRAEMQRARRQYDENGVQVA